jgi:carbon storage regulator
MLVLSRKPGEKVRVGNDITLVVLEVNSGRVRIGIDAPSAVRILRLELWNGLIGPLARKVDRPRRMRVAHG